MTKRKPGKAGTKTPITFLTPADRKTLLPRKAPYWQKLIKGKALGYRKDEQGGVWVARLERPRRQVTLGTPDGEPGREELPMLTFEQAMGAARAWCEQQAQVALRPPPQASQPPTPSILASPNPGPLKALQDSSEALPKPFAVIPSNPTLRQALDEYLKVLESRQIESVGTSRSRIRMTQREIGDLELKTMVPKHLQDWRAIKIAQPPRIRGKKGQPPRFKADFDPNDPATKLKRQSTSNRALADVLAALHIALDNRWVNSNDGWRGVEPFPNCIGKREDVLTPAQWNTLLNRASLELRPLVYGALLTGQRFGPLSRLLVEDFKPYDKYLRVGYDKAHGRERLAPLTDEALAVFWAICKDRPPKEPLFLRANGKRWKKSSYNVPLKEAKGDDIKITFNGFRHTTVTYWLLRGVPDSSIAVALATSEQIIREHYQNVKVGQLGESLSEKVIRIGTQSAEVDEILGIINQGRTERLMPERTLNFTLRSLNPRNYQGKIHGGADDPPPPKPKPTREELAVLVKEMPVSAIGKKYEVSGNTVGKWCRQWGIRTPRRGVWAKLRGEEYRQRKAEGATGDGEWNSSDSASSVPKPSREELAELLHQMPATEIAVRFCVTGPTILKWAQKWGLPLFSVATCTSLHGSGLVQRPWWPWMFSMLPQAQGLRFWRQSHCTL